MIQGLGILMVCVPFISVLITCAEFEKRLIPTVVILGLTIFITLWIITGVVLICY